MQDVRCSDIENLKGRYVDRTLESDERARVEAHLAACEACARSFAEVARVDELLARAAVPGPSDAEWQALLGRARMRPMLRWPRLAAAAVIATAIPLSLAAWYGSRDRAVPLDDVWTPGIDMEF